MNIPKKLPTNSQNYGSEIKLELVRIKVDEIISYLQAKEEASKKQYIYTCSCSAVYDPELKNCPACGEKTIDNGKYLCYTCNQWVVIGNHKCEASKGGCACKSYETVEIGCEVCHPELKLDLPERKGECMHEGDRSNFHPQYCTKCGKEFMYDNPPEHEESLDEQPFMSVLSNWRRKQIKDYIRDNFVSKTKIKREANLVWWPTCECGKSAGITERAIRQLLKSLGLGD